MTAKPAQARDMASARSLSSSPPKASKLARSLPPLSVTATAATDWDIKPEETWTTAELYPRFGGNAGVQRLLVGDQVAGQEHGTQNLPTGHQTRANCLISIRMGEGHAALGEPTGE